MPTPATRTRSSCAAPRARSAGSKPRARRSASGPPTAAADHQEPWRRREDLLCLFTDGIVDATGEAGQRFGEDRLLAHVQRVARPGGTQEILEAIFADLAAFTGGAPSSDDRTLLIAKV